MNSKIKFVVAAIMAIAAVSPAIARSYSFPTDPYLHPQVIQRNAEVGVRRDRLYDYQPTQSDQSGWPPAAAMGNSH